MREFQTQGIDCLTAFSLTVLLETVYDVKKFLTMVLSDKNESYNQEAVYSLKKLAILSYTDGSRADIATRTEALCHRK